MALSLAGTLLLVAAVSQGSTRGVLDPIFADGFDGGATCAWSGSFSPTIPGGCQINGACYFPDEENPDNPCQLCDPAESQVAWTDRGNGTLCDDGLFCTLDDACVSGVCSGAPNACGDPDFCTDDVCDEDLDVCQHPPIDCDDLVGCTVDTCLDGLCANVPDDLLCPVDWACGAGTGCEARNVAFSELGVLGNADAERIEVVNLTGTVFDLTDFTLGNGLANFVIRSAADPTGALGTPVNVAASEAVWGAPNPAQAANIPAGADFVFGLPGTAAALDDAGGLVRLYAPSDTVVDEVSFASPVSDPAAALTNQSFALYAGHTTQVDPAALSPLGNDDPAAWCVTFRSGDTLGSANGDCDVAVVNELLYDTTGADDGQTYVELAAPGGSRVLAGARLEDVEGLGAAAGQRNSTDLITLPGTLRVPVDGLLLVADELGAAGTTLVPNVGANDVITRDADFENSGGDAAQLVTGTTQYLDALAHSVGGAMLDVSVAAFNGLPIVEVSPARSTGIGVSLSRDDDSSDTGSNLADFHGDPTPTPGVANGAVALAFDAAVPDDLPIGTSRSVTVSGDDFAPQMTLGLGAQPPVACTVTSSSQASCSVTAPGAAARVDATLTNPVSASGQSVTRTAGFTFTAALNETDTPAEGDYCVLQFPLAIVTTPGQQTAVYGRLFEAGVTPPAGAPPGWIAELGYGPSGSNPISSGAWLFATATFNVQFVNDDEFVANLTAPAAGSYAYTYRFSVDDGVNWTYCDIDGAGSNPGLTFSAASLGGMTVNP